MAIHFDPDKPVLKKREEEVVEGSPEILEERNKEGESLRDELAGFPEKIAHFLAVNLPEDFIQRLGSGERTISIQLGSRPNGVIMKTIQVMAKTKSSIIVPGSGRKKLAGYRYETIMPMTEIRKSRKHNEEKLTRRMKGKSDA